MMRALALLACASCLATIALTAGDDAGSFVPVTADEIPEQFRDAPAVVLEDTRNWDVVPARRATYTVRRRLLVLDRRGFRFADRHISYDRFEAVIDSFHARTILPDGEIIPVPEDLRNELVTYKDQDQEWHSLHFTFPRVRVGAVLEWDYTLFEKDPGNAKWWEVQDEIPVIEARFHARVKQPPAYYPLGIRAYTRVDHGGRCKVPQQNLGARKSVFEMVCQDIPALVSEDLSPPDADLAINFVVGWATQDFGLASWNGKTRQWRAYIDHYIAKRPAVAALAAELVRDEMTDEEKVNAIYGFIKREMEVRTVYYAPRQRGKQSTFESVDEMLAHGGGLPSEITMLTLALLREAGVGASPVLAQDRTEGRFVPRFPDGSQANHLMLQVNIDGQKALLDPSCRYCEAGTPDWRFCDTRVNALRVGGFANAFAVGVVPARRSAEVREERAVLSADGHAAVRGTVTWTGYSEIDRRRAWDGLSEAARRDEFRATLPDEVDDPRVEVSDPEEFFEHLSASYEFHRTELPPLPDGRLLIRPPDVFTSQVPVPMQEERIDPLWLRYAYSVQSKVVFRLPEGYRIAELPRRGESVFGPGMMFKHQWKRGPRPDEVTWKGQLTVGRTEIRPEQYAEARDFARRLRFVLQGGVVAGGPGGAR